MLVTSRSHAGLAQLAERLICKKKVKRVFFLFFNMFYEFLGSCTIDCTIGNIDFPPFF